MKKDINVLDNALLMAKKKKYDGAIRLLEGEIFNFRESFLFYYILALSCLRTGDYGRAYTYFKSAYDIKKDANTMIGIAAINLRRGESAKAIDFYLRALDIDSDNKKAAKALGILKKYSGDDLIRWVDSGKIEGLFPAYPPSRFKLRRLILPLILCAAAACAVLIATGKIRISDITERFIKEERVGFKEAMLNSQDREEIAETRGNFQTILTENEILNTFEKARMYFNNNDDNNAIVEINKIKLSNAGPGIKNKADLLMSYINKTPHTLTSPNINTQFSYNEVVRNPQIYNNCYVAWKGMPANIRQSENAVSFDLLAGYENKTKFFGTVPVYCPFAEEITPEQPIEVFGQVRAKSAGDNSLSLIAITLHQSIRGAL